MVRRVSSVQTKSRRRRDRTFSYRNELVFLVLLLSAAFTKAQVSIGLYEGLMGNGGAALSDPTAASFYNPSLLNKKTKDSYSLSGSTLGTFSSKSSNAEVSSFALNPGYLSTILIGDALVHEFFIANVSIGKIKIVGNSNTNDMKTTLERTLDQNQFVFGYSMAFSQIPFALSYFGYYSQIDDNGFSESTSLTSNERSTTTSKLEYKSLGVGLSVSGYTSIEGYTLGYNFKSRQLIVFKKDQQTKASYVHTGLSPTDYQKTVSENTNQNSAPNGSAAVIGHSFQTGKHEFTTDSQFSETSELIYKFNLNQTFGYRYNSSSGHQFLCGVSQQLGPEVRYFGQSTYYSAGYSWLKNSLRSVLGGYVYTSRIDQDVFAVGLTFGSEFNY